MFGFVPFFALVIPEYRLGYVPGFYYHWMDKFLWVSKDINEYLQNTSEANADRC